MTQAVGRADSAHADGGQVAGRGRRPRRIARYAAFWLALGVCWFSAGFSPYREMFNSALYPVDFTPDYVVTATWVRDGRWWHASPAVLNRRTADAHARALGAPNTPDVGAYHTHPPTAMIPILPLVPLGYRGAVMAWLVISTELLAVLAWVVAPILGEAGWPIKPAALFGLLLLWPPSLACFELGQWTFALAATMALAHRSWERNRHRESASWLAVATALKLTPVLVSPALLLRDRRAGLQFAAVLLGLIAVCLPVGGLSGWITMFQQAGPNAAAWQSFWDNTTSINGLAVRLFVGGRWAQPLGHWPAAATALRVGLGGALVGTAWWATRRLADHAPDRNREGCALALWYVLPAVLNPLGWSHYALLLLLPAALAARHAAAKDDRWVMGLVLAGITLASVPKFALLSRIARPWPTPPHRSIFLSIHLYAALLIFAAAARGALRRIDKPAALK